MNRIFDGKSEAGAGSRQYIEEILKNARGGPRRTIDILREIVVDMCETAGLATVCDVDDLNARMDLIEQSLRELENPEA